MTATLVWLRLRWPRDVADAQVVATWRILARVAGRPLVVEAAGSDGTVSHRLAVPVSKQLVVTRQLQATIPGAAATPDDGPLARQPLTFDMALALGLTTRQRALVTDDLTSTSQTLLTALAAARYNETLLLQWVLGRTLPPRAVSSRAGPPESWHAAVARALTAKPTPVDSEARRAWASKQSEAGWRVVGRIAVRAASDHRQRHLLSQLLGALRTAEAPGVGVTAHRIRPSVISAPKVPWRFALRLNTKELAVVSAWPVGVSTGLPIMAIGSRLMAPSRSIPRRGKVVAEANFPGAARPLALSTNSALRHLHLVGPTGVGKSTALLNLITQDMGAGHAVAVIEPKRDLVNDVLARIPNDRVSDVVVLDPTDPDAVVGLNPLGALGRSPELVADQLLAVFHRLYAAHWGPRTHDILGSALATLAQVPDMTLCALPLLLADASFRRRIVAQISDPIGLRPFWSAFEAWSEAERTAAVAPVQNKLRPFLVNPKLRTMLGQARPCFAISQLFTDRTILLVDLAKGIIGPEAAALLGSLVMAQLWQGALGRSAVPANRRRPVFIYVDEFQDYLNLPVDLADALGQARGLSIGVTLAHQHLQQLDPAMRSAVLANARSRLCFQLASEDARVMASGSQLEVEDFTQLGAYECYVQLVAGDSVQPWCSGRTLPPPPSISNPGVIRARSRQRYGTPRGEVEAAIARLVDGEARGRTYNDLAPRRRRESRGGQS
jgi:hypothetical protein